MRKKVVDYYTVYGSGGKFLECMLECGHWQAWFRHTQEGRLVAPATMTCGQCKIANKEMQLAEKRS